jgi:hypothetical protein
LCNFVSEKHDHHHNTEDRKIVGHENSRNKQRNELVHCRIFIRIRRAELYTANNPSCYYGKIS